jgi:hypothetical protein
MMDASIDHNETQDMNQLVSGTGEFEWQFELPILSNGDLARTVSVQIDLAV